MGFFIADQTTCPLCEKVIQERSHAAQLPYVHPSVDLPPAFRTRPFVHRTCWASWPARESFIAAAEQLVRASSDQDDDRVVQSVRDGLVIERWHQELLRVRDVELLVTIDVPTNKLTEFSHWINTCDQAPDASIFEVGTLKWSIAAEDGSAELVLTDADGEQIERLTFPAARRAQWLTALSESTQQPAP